MNPSLLRRYIMAVGAAFLVGGWASMQYAAQYQDVKDAMPPSVPQDLSTETFFLAAISMAVGAGLIGFAVLRPTTRD